MRGGPRSGGPGNRPDEDPRVAWVARRGERPARQQPEDTGQVAQTIVVATSKARHPIRYVLHLGRLGQAQLSGQVAPN